MSDPKVRTGAIVRGDMPGRGARGISTLIRARHDRMCGGDTFSYQVRGPQRIQGDSSPRHNARALETSVRSMGVGRETEAPER